MRSKMTPAQLDALKGSAINANALNQLATKANGLGVSRADRDKADQELTRTVGSRKAAQLKEDALQRAGARPKGLLRWIG
ncbi:hypothetical protein ACWEJ6_52140 [Nonomuraea sp. NPDC004702]